MLTPTPLHVDRSSRGEALPAGTIINGRYVVRRTLGHGGQGWVYDVEDGLLPDRPVALKIATGLSRHPALLSMFEVEFSIMTRLDHPNVAHVYDFEPRRGTDDFLITMERVDGLPINHALEPYSDWRVVLEHVVHVCRALSYMHSRQIVHYDLKPHNILVASGMKAKIVDFGIAGGPLRRDDQVNGTPLYMAPELLLGGDHVDHRCDLYSLGITLHELLFGRLPSPEGSVSEIIAWLAAGGLRFDAVPEIPAWLARLLEKLCAIDPADRYRSANAVISAINQDGGFDFPLETDETKASYIATPRFSGRQPELEAVLDFVSNRLRGRGGVRSTLWVRGPSGIGKSRLMKEVRQTAQLQQLVFIESNCYESAQEEYAPVAAALYQLVPLVECVGGQEIVADALPALVTMAPNLARGRQYTPLPMAESVEGDRVRLLSMTGDFFVRAAGRVPFALYMNDMQWAARGPARLFSYLAQRAGDDEAVGEPVRYALIGSYRSDEVEGRPLADAVAVLQAQGMSVDVVLDRLSTRDLGTILGSMLGIDDVPATFLERIEAETQGNPFFAHEVMHVLLENGSVYLEDGRWATSTSVETLAFPGSVADIFRRRLSLLSAEDMHLVRILAVHGRPLDHERLVEICDGVDRATLMNRLLALWQRSVLVKKGGDTPLWNVAHDHMRETIYSDLSSDERADLHRRLGLVLERATVTLPEQERPLDDIARHYREGGDARALEYAVLAGRRALQTFANGSAVSNLTYALSCLAETDPRYEEMLEGAADALSRVSRFDSALEGYHRLLARPLTNLGRARIQGKVADIFFQIGQLDASEEAAWRALEALGEHRPRNRFGWLRATLGGLSALALSRIGLERLGPEREQPYLVCANYTRLLWVYMHTDNMRAFSVTLFNWRAVARAADAAARAIATGGLGVYLGMAGLLRFGRALVEEAREDAEMSGSALALGHVYSWRGMLMRYAQPRDLLDHQRSRAEYERAGDLFGANLGSAHIVWALWQRGQVDAAVREATQYRQHVLRLAGSPIASSLLPMEGVFRTQQMLTPPEEIEALFRRAEEMSQAAYGSMGQLQLLRFRAWSRLLRGQVEEAVTELEHALTIREQSRNITNYAFEICVRLPYAYLQLPALTPAQRRALRRTHRAAMRGTARFHQNMRPYALLNEALIRDRHGQHSKAERYFADAVAVARLQEALLPASLALYEWGRSRQRRGEHANAEPCLRDAREIAFAGGDRWMAQRCETALGGARSD